MSITFTAGDTSICVPYETAIQSEYVKDLVNGFGNNVLITIPDRYLNRSYNRVICNQAFEHYITFLRSGSDSDSDNDDSNSNKVNTISDKNKLKQCFDIYSYFVDSNYFNFLIQQLHNNWGYVFTAVYTSINPGLQREIFLHVPYDMLPQEYIDNEIFFGDWIKQNKNKTITLNTSTIYYCDVTGMVDFNNVYDGTGSYTVTLYHTICNKELGIHKILEYNASSYLMCESGYVMIDYNYCKHGIWREWILIGNKEYKPKCQGYYDKGIKQGLWTEWYYCDDCDNKFICKDNFVIMCECQYVDNKRHGWCRTWYTNGKLASDHMFDRDEKHGECKNWVHDDKGQYAFVGSNYYNHDIIIITEYMGLKIICVDNDNNNNTQVSREHSDDFNTLMNNIKGSKYQTVNG